MLNLLKIFMKNRLRLVIEALKEERKVFSDSDFADMIGKSSFMLNTYKTVIIHIVEDNLIEFVMWGLCKSKNRSINRSSLFREQIIWHFF